ncbi:recombinase family protein [Nocardioides caricicola]|uniref:Recombinase family protein n=1 Tax=Nocardioides caricicola TaxID=634770 RepID=A0ABW0N6B4_9ACTN
MNDTQRRCAIYFRISLDPTGEGLAIERQREDCTLLARIRGWEIVETYVDSSISASDRRARRPAYERMAQDYMDGRFSALICYDLDRLTRQPRQLEDWIEAAEERNLVLVTANGEADLSTDGGRLFARLKASVARAEVERKSERQKRAMAQRVARGRIPSGVRLTGYDRSGEVVPEEALHVREIFERFIAGDSLRAIAASLAERGVMTRRGASWNPSTVRTILLNPRYAGLASLHGAVVIESGERVRGSWEPIVTEATFDAANSILAEPGRKMNRVGTDRRHLGSGLFLCSVCDRRVRSHNGRYRCPEGHLIRSMKQVDLAVLSVVRARLGAPDLVDLLDPEVSDEATGAASETADLLRRLSNIERDYDDGLIDGHRYAVAREKVTSLLREASARRLRLTTNDATARTLSSRDPVAAFDLATLGVRRQVLDTLIQVRLHSAPRGRKTFDPSTVCITWRSVTNA